MKTAARSVCLAAVFDLWWCVAGLRGLIRRKKFLLEKVYRVFEDSDRLFENFAHRVENYTRILESPGFIRISDHLIGTKPNLLKKPAVLTAHFETRLFY